jgi:GntR family transcriptional regulator
MEFKSNKAIYLQIADALCERILRGEYDANDRIPAIRDYAVSLEVNPNTVTRTYGFLEEKGIITMQRGVGYFVTPDAVQIILDLKRAVFFNEDIPALFNAMELMQIDMDQLVTIYQKRKDNDEQI